MSLIRQMWLTVVVSTVLALIGSLVIGIWSARDYLVEQLARQNSDNATSLALSMTQREKRPVTIDLQIASLFDTGYYQEIRVSDPFGKLIAERVQDKSETSAPAWFVSLLPIDSRPGVAQVSDGWKQFATVQVISHQGFAYQALWQQAQRLFAWFLLGGAAIGLIGMLMLRRISRALGSVVDQANAIGQRRFITIPLPRTPELRALVQAMNSMVERIRQMFNDEVSRLETLRQRVNFDPQTGLPNRDYFMAHLREELGNRESASQGLLAIMRLLSLDEIKTHLSDAEEERLLREAGRIWNDFIRQYPGGCAGRVKLEDFALFIPGNADPHAVAEALDRHLHAELLAPWPGLREVYHLGIVHYRRDEPFADILSAVDNALAIAEGKGPNCWHAMSHFNTRQTLPGARWKTLLTEAIAGHKLELVFYPAVAPDGRILHQEGMIRLQADDQTPLLTAAEFMPVAAHLHLSAPIDLAVIRLAIAQLAHTPDDIAINLSPGTLGEWGFHNDLVLLLKAQPALCHRLWFEVPEHGALKHFEAFKELCRKLKGLGCRVGVEQFELHLAESSTLTELGLDYVKLPPSLLQGLAANAGNREYLERFCLAAHSIGITVIAAGLQAKDDLAVLKALGVDAATGPGASG